MRWRQQAAQLRYSGEIPELFVKSGEAMSIPLPIGRVAVLLGIPAWRIRDWETKGFVSPIRKPSGHRLFAEAEIRRLVELRDLLVTGHVAVAQKAAPSSVSVGPTRYESQPTQPTKDEPREDRNAGLGAEKSASLGMAAMRLLNAVSGFESLTSALEFALDTALELVDARTGTISYADTTRRRYVLAAHRGLSLGYVKGIETWQLDEGIAGRAYNMREPILIEDLASDPIVPRKIVHEEGLRGYVCVPILRGGQRLGIVEVFSKTRGAFSAEDVRAIELVGFAVAMILANSRLNDELEFFRSQRDNISRHWMTQLNRAVEHLHAGTAETIVQLADSVSNGELVDPGAIEQELRGLAGSLTQAHFLAVNLRETVDAHFVEGVPHLMGRKLKLDTTECDVNIEYGFAGRIVELLELLIAQIAHASKRRVSVRIEVRESIELEVRDDVERPNRTDFVQSMDADCTRLLKGLDAEARSPVAGFGCSAIWVKIPLMFADRALQELTPREIEVLGLLSRGRTNRELAHELFISPKTLQNHLTAIYRKLRVNNRTEAIAVASSQI